MKSIQTDPAVEDLMGRRDIYIHPEQYTHVIHAQMESGARLGSIILETDRFKAWSWSGRTWKRKKEAGIGRVGFRRKVLYSRFKPNVIPFLGGILIRAYREGGELVHTLEYHDAVDPNEAMLLAGRYAQPVEIVKATVGPDGTPESYESLRARADARVFELNA